ncbi:ammonia-forming cytochrome c nitrite reductase subunit c552 [Kordiimonas sp.]|uniref:ammonia-forming cytochrome c nitrite reductase subunit c552 n=1 Tax=Kordiimonas sp. TaxID=1970157 RepID=UPI003A8D7B09
MLKTLTIGILTSWSALCFVPAGSLAADYTGSQVCKTCHVEQFEAWHGSHHDLAMETATAENVLGNFGDASLTYDAHQARFILIDGYLWVEVEAPDGSTARFKVVKTFGVYPLQQYLVATTGGRLQALPFAWDSRPEEEGGQRWFHLYADEQISRKDRLHWQQPLQNWNGMCADCHSTGLTRNYDPVSDLFDTRFAEEDVACEACHGPASGHVAAVSADASANAGPDADDRQNILSYLDKLKDGSWRFDDGASTARWDGPPRKRSELQMCAGCHSRRGALKDGFHAGENFHDNFSLALIESPMYFADGQVRDEAYVYGSFLQSKMHGKGVTCTDCHNPHTLKLRAEGNAVCTQCHVAEEFDAAQHHGHKDGSAGAACVNCHMPETTFMGVDARRDHSLRIPRPDFSMTFGTPNACNTCHSDRSSSWAADALQAWHGEPKKSYRDDMVRAFSAAWKGDPRSKSGLRSLALNEEVPTIVRASAFKAMEPFVTARDTGAIRAGLSDSEPLVRYGAIRAATSLPAVTRAGLLGSLLRDKVRRNRIEAARALADVADAALPAEMREAKKSAEVELLAAYEQDSWRGEGGANLAQYHELTGDFGNARKFYEQASRVDPWFSPAKVNLANLYQQLNDDNRAELLLKKALVEQPEEPALNYAYAILLIRAGDYGGSLPHFRTAWQGAQANGDYGYAYGTALNTLGQSDVALDVYTKAISHAPNHPNLLHGLASLHVARGEAAKAVKYARRLSRILRDDPSAQQFLRVVQQQARQ